MKGYYFPSTVALDFRRLLKDKSKVLLEVLLTQAFLFFAQAKKVSIKLFIGLTMNGKK